MEIPKVGVLIVDTDSAWIRTVRDVAESLQFDPIDTASSSGEVSSLLAQQRYDLGVVGVSVGGELFECAKKIRLVNRVLEDRLGAGQRGMGVLVVATAHPNVALHLLEPINGPIADDILIKTYQPEVLRLEFESYKLSLLAEKQKVAAKNLTFRG